MRATHIFFLAVLSSGCLVHNEVGDADGGAPDPRQDPTDSAVRDAALVDGSAPDTTPTRDAGRDVATADVPVTSSDAATADASGQPVSHVVVEALTGRAALGGWHTSIGVRLYVSEPPDHTVITATPGETNGNCVAYSPAPTGQPAATGIDAGTIVTYRLSDGSSGTLRYLGGTTGYYLDLSRAIADGTTGSVTIAERPGVIPALTIPIVFSPIAFRSPMPMVNAAGAQNLRYTAGADFIATWQVPMQGDTNAQVRMWFMNNTATGMNTNQVMCTVTPSAGTATAPWSMLSRWVPTDGPNPGSLDGTMVGLSYIHRTTQTLHGVSVRIHGGGVNAGYLVAR